ncbi:MAG: CBS domain-containing protein [Nitrospira sp.]|nr:CBS domain-containing protein [Nitrospira sp.]
MKVQDMMTSDAQCCSPDTNLATAAKMMWDSDCGALPVVRINGQVVGMITDRDICVAAATKNKPPSEITVWETTSGKAYTCRPTDDVHMALDIMKRERVRRIPVVDEDGVLRGIIAMNDFLLVAQEAKGKNVPAVSYEDVVHAMKAISAHRILVGI